MAAVKAKELRYEVSVDALGRMAAESEPATHEVGDEWTPDHLLLAAVVRCAIVSLGFHARRAGIDVVASGSASGCVTRPEGEERFRFVEVSVELEVALDPKPDPEALGELLARAERDCFVGSSLIVSPDYRWHVA